MGETAEDGGEGVGFPAFSCDGHVSWECRKKRAGRVKLKPMVKTKRARLTYRSATEMAAIRRGWVQMMLQAAPCPANVAPSSRY